MAHIGINCNPLPIAAPAFQQCAYLGVKIGVHEPIIAKHCDSGKQHFAPPSLDTEEVDQKPINTVVAEALDFFMGTAWTNVSLGIAADVAESTIRNYLKPENRTTGKTGKEPSAKLTELAKLAAALGVQVSDLVTDATDEERLQIHRKRAAEHYVKTGQLPTWAPPDRMQASAQSIGERRKPRRNVG